MRLIGGNISDTPVKEIGDGSAFSVAAPSGFPALLSLGSWSALSSAISATGWEDPRSTGHGGGGGGTIGYYNPRDYVLINNNATLVNANTRRSDNEIYLATIPISGGALGTPTAAQDKSGDFTATSSGHLQVMKDPASENKVIVVSFSDVSTRKIEMGCYTVSGATFTKVGSIQTHTMATNLNAAFENLSVALHSDGNTGVVTCINNTSTNQVQCIPFNHTSDQKFGTAVASGITAVAGQFSSTLIGSGGEVVSFAGKNRVLEWTLTTGTTPSVAFHEDHSQNPLGTTWNNKTGTWPVRENGNGVGLIQLDEPEDPGQCCFVSNYGGQILRFSGVTHGKHRVKHAKPSDATSEYGVANVYPWNFGNVENIGESTIGMIPATARFLKVDETGGWCRGIMVMQGNLYASDSSGQGYGPIIASALNVHVATGSIEWSDTHVESSALYTTNAYTGNMNAIYVGGNVIALAETSAASRSAASGSDVPDAYMSIPVTIT